MRQLVAPAQDAQALAEVLANPSIGEFEIKTLLNESSEIVRREIEIFFSNRKRDDLLLLYFSCHGIKDQDGKLYFSATDTDRILLRSTAIASNFVNEVMQASRSRRQLLLLDCCYSGAFARGMSAKAGMNIHTKEHFDGRGRVVLTASDAIQYAFEQDKIDGDGTRSVFTSCLVKGLETGAADSDGDGEITIDELYDYISEHVMDEKPEQRPEKWNFGVQGKLIVAKNPNPREKPVDPGSSLKHDYNHIVPWIRAVVNDLFEHHTKTQLRPETESKANNSESSGKGKSGSALGDTTIMRLKVQGIKGESLEKKFFVFAIFTLLLGNTAILIGHIHSVRYIVFDIVGYLKLGYLHNYMQIIVSILLLLGYLSIFVWLYQKLLFSQKGAIKIFLILICLVSIGGSAYFNISLMMPSEPQVKPLVAKEIDGWMERVIQSQSDNGGVRMDPTNIILETQVWTTAQCLKAVLASGTKIDKNLSDRIKNAFDYIEKVRIRIQNEGWGYQDNYGWGITEIAAWVSLAYIETLRSENASELWSTSERTEVLNRIIRDLNLIAVRQHQNGGWSPINNVSRSDYTRTYSTVMALWSLLEAKKSSVVFFKIGTQFDNIIKRGIGWLMKTYITKNQMGWVPNPNRENQTETFLGLSAQTLFVLSLAENDFEDSLNNSIYKEAKNNFIDISGLFSREINDNDRAHDGDRYLPQSEYAIESMTFLWYPWTLAVYEHLSNDSYLSKKQNQIASNRQKNLLHRIDEVSAFVKSEQNYVLGEFLYCLSMAINKKGFIGFSYLH